MLLLFWLYLFYYLLNLSNSVISFFCLLDIVIVNILILFFVLFLFISLFLIFSLHIILFWLYFVSTISVHIVVLFSKIKVALYIEDRMVISTVS